MIRLPMADHYTVLEVRKDETGKYAYRVCESVTVIPRGEGIRKTELSGAKEKIHMAG